MCRVLFLYATGNSGHQKAARAIEKSLNRIAPHIKTAGIDFFTYHYPTLGPFIFRMYLDLLQSIPHIWDYLYDSPDVASVTRELRQFFNFLNIPKLHQILQQFKPDVIVCTQAVPAGFIATEKQRGKIDVPLLVTITDFVANPYWPSSHVDCYFVPDHEIRDQLLERHIPAQRIRVTGIPVDDSFGQKTSRIMARMRLGLNPNLPTVLIMGGSQGLGQISGAVKEMAKINRYVQTIVVTGHNKSLYRHLKQKFGDRKNILILSAIRSVSRIMDASDLLISKPGGLTSSEALAKGLPMIILAPLPGQEERNASFLVRNGVAERCDTAGQLPSLVERVFAHPYKLRRMQAQALLMGKPFSSRDIALSVMDFVH